MPNIGEIKKASELGYKRAPRHDCLYTFSMCTRCSRTRWVRNQDLKVEKGRLCRSCSHTTNKSFCNRIERVVESGAKRASELGKPVFKNRDPWYYPHLCKVCGEETWHQRKDLQRACKKCAYEVRKTSKGEAHGSWKGGRYRHGDGYVLVQVLPTSPYYPMAHERGYILEHRLVMAQQIGRCLSVGEIVHHINGDKQDNRPENLELLPHNANHLPYIVLQREVAILKTKVADQDKEIKLLKWHIREIEQGNPELAGDNGPRASVTTLQGAHLDDGEEKV